MSSYQPSERQINAMQAIFALSEAMGGEMSIKDLVEVMRLAVADGETTIALQLEVATTAAWLLSKERGSTQ